jgi:hypothetical protein
MNSCLNSSNSNNSYGYIYDSIEESSRMVENILGYSLHSMMNNFQEDDYWLMKETMLCSVDQINQHNIDEVVVENNIASTSVSLFGYDSVDSFNFSPHATDNNNNRTTNIVESKKKSFKKVVHWSRDEHM